MTPSVVATLALIGNYSLAGFSLSGGPTDAVVTYDQVAVTTLYDNPNLAPTTPGTPSHPTV
jgi:hypothetical protein